MTGPPGALLVEDTPEFVALGTRILEEQGFVVSVAGDGLTAVDLARTTSPELVLLDITLPGMDGIEVCRRIREFSDTYVIMLTSRAGEVDRVVGLAIGADDYVTKPYSVRELAMRIKAIRRRPRIGTLVQPAASPTVVRIFGQLTIDVESREVRLGGHLLSLTRTEYDLLDTLTARPRHAFSRRQLLESVWGSDWFGDDHLVDVHLANLRRKLGETGTQSCHLQTLRGVGYRFDP